MLSWENCVFVNMMEFAALADEWEAQCVTLGRNVTIRMGDRVLQGRAESLDEDGALQLRTQHGRLERIVGGDVTMEPAAIRGPARH